MQLLNDFYTLSESLISETDGFFQLKFNASHAIYKSHFPENPVTPGVCLCAIARELVELIVGKPLQLTAVKNAKFLKVLSPIEHPIAAAKVKLLIMSLDMITAQISIEALEGEPFAKLSITTIEKRA